MESVSKAEAIPGTTIKIGNNGNFFLQFISPQLLLSTSFELSWVQDHLTPELYALSN